MKTTKILTTEEWIDEQKINTDIFIDLRVEYNKNCYTNISIYQFYSINNIYRARYCSIKDIEDLKVRNITEGERYILNNIHNYIDYSKVKEMYSKYLKNNKEKKEKIDKKYNDLMKAYEYFNYKKDINTLKEMDDLLYCEVEPLLDKIYDRINKKYNAKNIRLFKYIKDLNNEKYIECKE